jgi:hypothetical protein
VRELSLHILDIVENSIEAGATKIEIQINESTARNELTIAVTDNGRGMDQETLKRVSDPFFTTRTTRHVGLGIPLLKAAAERCNGRLLITSQPGQGTRVMAEFECNHIDRAPLGDMRSTLLSVILSNKHCAIQYLHRVDAREFAFDTQEMRQLLGDVPLDHPRVREWLDDFLAEGYHELHAGPSD